MPFFAQVKARLWTPAGAVAAVAVVLRLCLLAVSWRRNPLVFHPELDGRYYLDWAERIAAGELLAGSPLMPNLTAAQADVLPYFLNPLTAYVAAFFRVLGGAHAGHVMLLVFQCFLAGATAYLAACTARRLFGRAAEWTAGLACALSSVLVHLDMHVSVSGLAAFLVAGAMWSTLPREDGEREFPARLRGPLATGVWLGVGALARPVTMFALPLVMWLYASRAREGPRLRALGLCVLGFVIPIAPSPIRNYMASGEPVLFTAASGANLYLGNNPSTRKYRTMTAHSRFRFNPFEMHEDLRRYMAARIGADASWGEISARLTRDGIDEFVREPGDSALFYVNKARWFLSPVEVSSSASLPADRDYVPWLRVAVIPTWLIAVLALTGYFMHLRRKDVSLGPGSLALAHGIVLTIVFPLSHYRSPAIPALAVLAGGAVAVFLAQENGAREGGRRRLVAGGLAVVLAVLAWLPPPPAPMRHSGLLTAASCAEQRGDYEEAARLAKLATEAQLASWPGERETAASWFIQGHAAYSRRDWEEVIRLQRLGLEIEPRNWIERLPILDALYHLNRPEEMLREIQEMRELEDAGDVYQQPGVRAAMANALYLQGKFIEARPHVEFALRHARSPRDHPFDRVIKKVIEGK